MKTIDRKPSLLLHQRSKDVYLLKMFLESQGFEVTVVEDTPGMEDRLRDEVYDLCVLDARGGQASTDRLHWLKYLRSFDKVTPAIFISDMENPDLVPAVLDEGADDCLRRPFNYHELASRIRAVLRRTGLRVRETKDFFRIGVLDFDVKARTVALSDGSGEVFSLTSKAAALLALLCMNMGEVVPKGEISRVMWGEAGYYNERVVAVNMSRLRRALAAEPRVSLTNQRGIGFLLKMQ